MNADLIIHNVRIATMVGGRYNLIEDGALLIEGSLIRWVGQARRMPDARAPQRIDGEGRLLTPGLIDCHTHLIFGGDRADEFEQRLRGTTYEEIARRGGGIISTVRATRQSSGEELARAARPRLLNLLREGVTTVEIKTGYGLDLESELAMVAAMEMLEAEHPVEIVKTFLGAHTLPPEFRERPDAYVDLVCDEMMPQLAPKVDAVDVFCETIAFTADQTRRIFEAARRHGLAIKIHAEQLSNLGAAKLAAEMGALSADHLEYLQEDGARAMAAHGTVAVLLPGAVYFLGETRRPPIELLRQLHVSMAVATDANPGTSPCFSLLTALNMACVLLRLTPEEALAAVTVQAARALGRQDRLGTVEVGKLADLVLWDLSSPTELSYYLGYNRCNTVIQAGQARPISQIA